MAGKEFIYKRLYADFFEILYFVEMASKTKFMPLKLKEESGTVV